MNTWKIWRALHNPPALHPVFQRTVLRPPALVGQRSFGWAGMVVNLVLGLSQYSPTILLFLMPFILIFTGITYGLDCAIRVGTTIAKERENDTFNLLSLSPSGALGASWAICTSALYRNRDFDRLHNIVRGSIIITIITITIIALIALALQWDSFSRIADPGILTIIHLVDLTAVVVAIYIEYVQSAILGTLIGMYVPTYTQNRVDTSVYAMGGFLLLQMTTYFLAYFFGFVILSDLYNWLKIHGDFTEISLSILRLGAFFMIREVMITTVWRALVERLNAQPSELELAMQFAP